MTKFDDDTAVQPAGDGRFMGRIDPAWWIVRGPNGGYVAAILLRAMSAAVADSARPPRSLTVHFLAPPAVGEIELTTVIERHGRSLTSVSARASQGGRLVATAMAAFSAPRPAPEYSELEMPEVPPPAQVPSLGLAEAPPHAQMLDFKPALGGIPFASGGAAITGGWFRMREPQVADPFVVTAYADGWFPAIFARSSAPVGVPTVDVTVHFRVPLPLPDAQPEDYYLVEFCAPVSQGGFMVEDGEIWSPSGQLIAQARQLAVVLSG